MAIWYDREDVKWESTSDAHWHPTIEVVTALVFKLGMSDLDFITLYPLWNYEGFKRQKRTEHRSKSGKLTLYKWHSLDEFNLTVDWVPASEACVVNSWWDMNTRLLFQVNSIVYDVKIMNDAAPLRQYEKPYNTYCRGKIELEGY